MSLPVRCLTCGTVLAPLKWRYDDMRRQGQPANTSLDRAGARRTCCRAALLTQFDLNEARLRAAAVRRDVELPTPAPNSVTVKSE